MPRYKRTRDEAGLDTPDEPELPPQDAELLTKLRNTWELASLMQYIFLFGEVVKIDNDLDIEDLEAECLRPTPTTKLPDIGLALLKFVSSHRGLTLDIFEEYTRRQYAAKAPQRNPFGDDVEPTKFNELDVFTRIRVLHQLSTWTLGNPDRIRGLMSEDEDNTNWRMEPLGWDKEDRSYFVLDDNRLYRRTDEQPPPPSPKAKTKRKPPPKTWTRGTRASKRRRIEESSEDEAEEHGANGDDDTMDITQSNGVAEEEELGFGFTSKTWECVAVTLDDYQEFMSTIFRSRDPNEKQLRARIEADVVPIIEKRAEALKQKQLKKLRELENLQKMATAKRSSRLAGKAEKEKQEREEREAEEKRQRDVKMALEEQARQKRIEEGHESRRLTREQRLREREAKRILHEEELAKLEGDSQRMDSEEPGENGTDGSKRISSRQLQSQREQHRLELERLAEEESKWIFDCAVCGVHGENLDDGTHSVACDRCNVWQHSKCHGLTKQQAERDDFHFVCGSCEQKEEDAKKPKLPTLKLGKSNSPAATPKPASATNSRSSHELPAYIARQLDAVEVPRNPDVPTAGHPSTSSHAPLSQQGHNINRYPPVGNFAPNAPRNAHPSSRPSSSQTWHQPTFAPTQQSQPGQPRPDSRPGSGHAGPATSYTNGLGTALPPHHQHHQFTHQQAVVSAGGHPGYHVPYQGSPPANMPYQAPPQSMYYPPPAPQQPPTHGLGPDQRPIAFHSPHANGTRLPPSSPVKEHPRVHGSPQATTIQSSPRLEHSPQTNLPPPTASSRPQFMQSPVKPSSSPALHAAAPVYQATATPQASLRTPFGSQGSSHSGHTEIPPSSASKLAADGMSGPWPHASSAIPQKHDQSPAPPSSSHGLDRSKILPPFVPLVPSPRQQAAAETGSVPVKKIPDLINGVKTEEQTPTNRVETPK